MSELHPPQHEPAGIRSGFVTLAGCPNVGKSTLLNRMVGEKVSIVSHVPQTTRNRIIGIKNQKDSQIVFVDTPGIHSPHRALTRILVETAVSSLSDVDIVVMIVEPAPRLLSPISGDLESVVLRTGIGQGDEYIIQLLQALSGDAPKKLLAINKVDKIRKRLLLPMIRLYMERFPFAEIVPISALTGENVDSLLRAIQRYLPLGPRWYPEDQVTDKDDGFRAAELIREKILELTREEVPYCTAVVLDALDIPEDASAQAYVNATIFVERTSQKGILIGKGGAKIKEIGTRARADIEALLGRHVYLDLAVGVEKNWRDSAQSLRRFGYEA